jgi:AcrR family transcriptional regulator
MLIHHFGSRETLLREAVETIREREATRFKRWLKRRRASPPTLPSLLRWHWKRLSAPQARPALRFFFEMYVLALYDPSQPAWMVGVPLAYWRGVLGQEPSEELETLIPATFRGLLLDLLATGERRRVERAFTAFVKRVAGGSA